jgi:hypothetical protein
MDHSQSRLTYLFNRYKDGTATGPERKALLEIVQLQELQEALKELIAKETQQVDSGMLVINKEQTQARADELLQKILAAVEEEADVIPMKEYVVKRGPITIGWWRYIAAASVILFIAFGTWFIVSKKQAEKKDIAIKTIQDIHPATNGAILTLDNGKQIILDSVHNGLIAQQGNSNIVKRGQELSYQSTGKATAVSYNMITTPKGRQYPNLILSDGSKVWLDAGSSIRFPVSFTGNERKVEITGQVWFDVVHNSRMPFKVVVKGIEINDLGTQFNVNAYDDEEKIKVTLLQGAINIQSRILKPGQQAQSENGHLSIVKGVDIDEVMAWKNGFFSFRQTDVKGIMRELSRWYDVEVRYEGINPTETFTGEIDRNLTLSEVLKILEKTRVHFRIEEGRKLVILP